MPLIPLKIKKGIYKNGTPYNGAARWVDGNLIRWQDKAVRPVGGWQRTVDLTTGLEVAALYAAPATEAPRAAIQWRTLAGNVLTAIATNLKLYILDEDNVVTDITPVGFVGGARDGTSNLVGYGVGPYGKESYGTPRQNVGQTVEPIFTWTMDVWGEELICGGRGPSETIYKWAPGDPVATAVPNAPTGTRGVVVTDQRILVTVGETSNHRLVSWSDSEDYTTWTSAVTNQAGSQTLNSMGLFRTAVQVGEVILILSELDAHVMRYIGPPYIFGFNRLGDSTLIVAPNAIAVVSDIAYWWGYRTFWMFDGNSISPIECEVMDFLEKDVDDLYLGKVTAHPLVKNNEIWWHYQSKTAANGEPDSYVAYNFLEGIWYTGRLERSVGVDGTISTVPIMVGADGLIWNHELATVMPDAETFLESGPIELGNGDQIMYIDFIHPDASMFSDGSSCDATMKLIMQDMQNAPEMEYGPYTLTNPTPTRARGRLAKLRIDGGSDIWHHGVTKLNALPGGGR